MRSEKFHTLFELNRLVRETIECEMPNEYWVEAELSECRELRGHCYMELIEKDKQTATPIAKASAKCWASKWILVRPYFERTTGQRLVAGMKVLLKVYPQFHEAFGFSWIVTDIDPTYTLGDMARKRQEIIRQLKEEGVFDLQKELTLPLFCQRIAVISSETAAGYGDFCNQLADNPYGFQFQTQLFPAIMQGEGVENSIVQALNAVFSRMDDFDCVVITRGGGATSDLSGFDALNLARNVANFPLPVITAIGHDRDESVLDMISNVRVKTPTAAASFLIDRLHHVETMIDALSNRVLRVVEYRIQEERMRVNHLAVRIPTLFSVVKTTQESKLTNFLHAMETCLGRRIQQEIHHVDASRERIHHLLSQKILKESHRMEILSQRVSSMDPQRILERGYSITSYEGKTVTSAQNLKKGMVVETRLKEGSFKSEVR